MGRIILVRISHFWALGVTICRWNFLRQIFILAYLHARVQSMALDDNTLKFEFWLVFESEQYPTPAKEDITPYFKNTCATPTELELGFSIVGGGRDTPFF